MTTISPWASACGVATVLALASFTQEKAHAPSARDDAAAEQLGWRLGVQAWTFRERTCFEAIDSAAKLGLKYIELYPGQALSPAAPTLQVGPDMGADNLAALKQKLHDSGVKALSFGVVGLDKDEAKARKVFAFAKELGLENLSAEPEPDALDLVARLADEFALNVAFHNHPQPSRYWSPDVVLEATKGRTKRLGSCADTGHWTRSGRAPVECLKKLEGRVLELHFKDLDAFGKPEALDVPWGTGKSDAAGILAELARQHFRGLIAVEYESGSGAELEQNVAKCIEFFDRTARAVVAQTH
ncbi:MAG: sugar phosphate isomerase/epimerase [Planctomycetes bacterium]|nr:sugar phosphate isomerase/epimerase [Planctomycetota bacterium]